ncbi:deoxyribonuclease IV [Metamycoplasma hyosynoviae]|uniref:deoxyribonuclease IV n=1 Tax=Metamycoplasma hyosynoviae TaxID=29559 RepID=UPI0023612BAB|nr:deoxyribonuclease IV [Metamycoplasma hyosynoviae]MDD1377674.1 deoxyribonuclease IV [Metamycoplasma hyosynoviae]
MIKLGSHVPFKSPNYLLESAETSLQNNANCMMIYLGPPQNSKRISTDKYHLDEYLQKYSSKITVEDIVIHAPYIINLANPEKRKFSTTFAIQEIKRANFIGAKYFVIHPGAFTSFTKQEGLNTLIDNLKLILNETENVVICIETMSGKGSEICTNFEDIMYVINSLNSHRIKICLDTCHIWDAGYDIKNTIEFMNYLKSNAILPHIAVIHLNDSLNEKGSHKDRHANISKGLIGTETLKFYVHCPEFRNIPIILETPLVDGKMIYKEEIASLLSK